MRFAERLHARWVQSALASYSPEAQEAWSREQDRFANPVGHALREGTRRILDALLGDGNPDAVRAGLDGIVRIRAIQHMAPSEAVSFVPRLRGLVREEAAALGPDEALPVDSDELERRIDEATLLALDLYVGYRERLVELRIQELKRNIPWAATRSGASAGLREAAREATR